MTQKIPKILHFCCFNYEGDKELPDRVQYCMRSWKEHCADWTWRPWTLETYDVQKDNLTRTYAKNKQWHRLADYVRFRMLYEEGGIYLDWDVELLKPLDDMLEYEAFFCLHGNYIEAGFFGTVKGHVLMKKNMEFMEADFNKYQGRSVSTLAPKHLAESIRSYGTFPGMLEGLKNVRVYDAIHSAPIHHKDMYNLMAMKRLGASDSEYISLLRKAFPPSDDTYAIHWFIHSWWGWFGGKQKNFSLVKKFLLKVIILPIHKRVDYYLHQLIKR